MKDKYAVEIPAFILIRYTNTYTNKLTSVSLYSVSQKRHHTCVDNFTNSAQNLLQNIITYPIIL